MLGHEGCGTACALGPGVTAQVPGQFIALYGPNSERDRRVCRLGETVVLIGLDRLDMNAVEIARFLGALVVAVDVVPENLAQARAPGTHETVDGHDVAALQADVTRAPDPDAGFIGSNAMPRTSKQVVLPGGRVVLVDLPPRPVGCASSDTPLNKSAAAVPLGTNQEPHEELALLGRGAIRPTVGTEPLGAVDNVLDRLHHGAVIGRIAIVL
jgi:D-arabinose 1-dehydrogenase-like Zn-dependent alcohol dehydrogenase